MEVQFKPQVCQRKRKRDGKIIDVPLRDSDGKQQLAIILDGHEVGLTIDRPGAAINLTESDLTDEEKEAISVAVEARQGEASEKVSESPSEGPEHFVQVDETEDAEEDDEEIIDSFAE